MEKDIVCIVTTEDIKQNDPIFNFAYEMAFRDSTMRNAFKRLDSEKNDINAFWDRKERIKDAAKPIVWNYIDEIIIKQAHPEPIDKIIEVHRVCKSERFTFGNAQKLVNMTAKYMFISSYGDADKRGLFDECDCPMDGSMIAFVKKEFEDYDQLKGFKCTKEYEDFINISWDGCWSKLDLITAIPEPYTRFQKCIKKICELRNYSIMPIEVDFFIGIVERIFDVYVI